MTDLFHECDLLLYVNLFRERILLLCVNLLPVDTANAHDTCVREFPLFHVFIPFLRHCIVSPHD